MKTSAAFDSENIRKWESEGKDHVDELFALQKEAAEALPKDRIANESYSFFGLISNLYGDFAPGSLEIFIIISYGYKNRSGGPFLRLFERKFIGRSTCIPSLGPAEGKIGFRTSLAGSDAG